jgi:hypothetical protein
MNHNTPIAPRPSASRIIQLIAVASVLILAGWNQRATQAPKEPSVQFVVLDKIPTPMPKRLKDELDAIETILQDPNRASEHDAARRKKTTLLTSYARTEEVLLYGIVIERSPQPGQIMRVEKATPMVVQIRGSEVATVNCGANVKAYTTGKPRMEGQVTHYTGKRVEKLGSEIEVELRLSRQLVGSCPIPWRTPDRDCDATVDQLEISYQGNLRLRVHNRSGFPLFGVFHLSVHTKKGAHVGDYSFLRLFPLYPSKECALVCALPHSYRSDELTTTLDTSCLFKWCPETP